MSSEKSKTRSKTNPESDSLWQAKLLPLMSKMLIGLTIFFFLISLAQLTYLHWNIRQSPKLDLGKDLSTLGESTPLTFNQEFKLKQFQVLTQLDLNAMERRHHQANVLLVTRVWTRYMGFVTGMILSIVGAVFILGKLREPVSEVDLQQGGFGATVKSSSPGLILAVLGVSLMIITIVVNHRIDVTDSPTYVRMLNMDEASAVDKPMISPPD